MNGQDHGVYCYTIELENETIYFYDNQSDSKSFQEKANYDMRNCSIHGFDGDTITIYLKPGQKKAVRVKSTGGEMYCYSTCLYYNVFN